MKAVLAGLLFLALLIGAFIAWGSTATETEALAATGIAEELAEDAKTATLVSSDEAEQLELTPQFVVVAGETAEIAWTE